MVVDFFGLVLLSLSVCLPNIFLDFETNCKIANALVTVALRKNIIFLILRHESRFLRSYHV